MSITTTKYVIVLNAEHGMEIPYVFPNVIYHIEFAKAIDEVAVSAGFCYVDDNGKYVAYGKSESLGLSARPEEDSHLLTFFLTGKKY